MAICGAFLVQFCSSAKTLRGRKDTLAQVYFYWGGQSPPSPPGIDATADGHVYKYTGVVQDFIRQLLVKLYQLPASSGTKCDEISFWDQYYNIAPLLRHQM